MFRNGRLINAAIPSNSLIQTEIQFSLINSFDLRQLINLSAIFIIITVILNVLAANKIINHTGIDSGTINF